jgi:hypothetical protein
MVRYQADEILQASDFIYTDFQSRFASFGLRLFDSAGLIVSGSISRSQDDCRLNQRQLWHAPQAPAAGARHVRTAQLAHEIKLADAHLNRACGMAVLC